ncbi:MAG: uroporphyrinogen-III synthase [Bryobacteraceae bacterium]
MSGPVRAAHFDGLRVLSLESRRAALMEQLIRRHGGDPFVAPSVKEIPFEQHDEAFRWADRLFAGDFDLLVLMTGAGLAYLRDILAERYPPEVFGGALRQLTIVSRGPKPAAVLHEMGVSGKIMVPEPNTWREIVPVIAARPERRITIQEYGRANPEFISALEALGAEVSAISIYRWMLPDDLNPLREAVRSIAERECDVVMFTTSIQLTHLLEVAARMGRAGEVRQALAEDLVIASVGPIMNAALEDWGFTPDIVPAHPKMAVLVRATAERAASVLLHKRRFAPSCASAPAASPVSVFEGGE